MAESNQRHWVEDLFPPHFTVDVEDLTRKPEQAAEGTLEAWRLAQRKKVKDIYQEVKDRMDAEARIPKHKNIQVGDPAVKSTRRIKLKGQVHRPENPVFKDGSPAGERDKENRRKSDGNAMWSAGELAILRDEFRKLKEDKRIILIEMRTLESELAEVRRKHKHQGKLLGKSESELKQSHQENKRLVLQNEHLTKEVRLQESKLAMAEDDCRDVVGQRLSLRKEVIDQRKSLARIRQDARELKIALSESDTRHRLESMEREEGMKLDYESQVARLYQELVETRAELEREKVEHSRSRKALDHLRIHFAQRTGRAEQMSDSEPSERTLKVLQLF